MGFSGQNRHKISWKDGTGWMTPADFGVSDIEFFRNLVCTCVWLWGVTTPIIGALPPFYHRAVAWVRLRLTLWSTNFDDFFPLFLAKFVNQACFNELFWLKKYCWITIFGHWGTSNPQRFKKVGFIGQKRHKISWKDGTGWMTPVDFGVPNNEFFRNLVCTCA